MMQEIGGIMERLTNITGIPVCLVDGNGVMRKAWPPADSSVVFPMAGLEVIRDFRKRERGIGYPLINFYDSGFLLGVMEVSEDLFILIGLVSPYHHTHSEILKMAAPAIHPEFLQAYCDRLLSQPTVSLEQLKDLMIVLSQLLDIPVPSEHILFVDLAAGTKLGDRELDQSMFEQREIANFHVPIDFETAICTAVEHGDRSLLERTLTSQVRGQVGKMSLNELRQMKYSFICLSTLVSRAAIQGGLSAETAFSLSDLYCQRVDLLTEISKIENLTFTMLMDFCGKVREVRKQPAASALIAKCLDYISVHLHEPIGLEELSEYCGLCGRSLSIRFRQELGQSIPQYIHQQKMKEAKYLLRRTDYSLTSIASCLNYPSQSYFTQIFKQNVHMTPQQYRDAVMEQG